jgi:hypothetical protein
MLLNEDEQFFEKVFSDIKSSIDHINTLINE